MGVNATSWSTREIGSTDSLALPCIEGRVPVAGGVTRLGSSTHRGAQETSRTQQKTVLRTTSSPVCGTHSYSGGLGALDSRAGRGRLQQGAHSSKTRWSSPLQKRTAMTEPSHVPSIDLPPGRYRLDPDQSQVRYSGKHMFGTGTVHATFAVREGEVLVDDAQSLSNAKIIIDAASFESNSAKRDKDVRSAGLLDVESYPDIVFSADSMENRADGWLVPGTVSAHGQTVAVHLHLDQVAAEGSGIRIHGSASHLDRTAFGITGSRGMVGRYLDLEIEAFATLS